MSFTFRNVAIPALLSALVSSVPIVSAHVPFIICWGVNMAYSVPVFNITVTINRHATGKVGGPDVSSLANLAWGRRVAAPASGGTAMLGVVFVSPVLLLPLGTDIRDLYCPSGADFVEAPAGSGRWYSVAVVDDIGKGFSNEHRAAVLVKSSPWPQPIP
jgi:hypothetical protein